MKPICLALSLFSAAAATAAPERHVVLVVFDGMRPDFVSPQLTPNLWKLSQRGVTFAHHHPVFCSSTEVNGTAIATGSYPSHSFVIANYDFRPKIDPQQIIGIEIEKSVRKGDEVSGGHYLGTPTLAEILHSKGIRTVVAGSKPVALLHDRAVRKDGPGVSPVLYEGVTQPQTLAAELTRELGDFPPIPDDQDKVARDAWTTTALTGPLWKNGLPAFSLLWLAEPDFSQHAAGPGAAQAITAIKSSDTNLGRVVDDIDRRGLAGSTDIIVVSDHGFSTIGRKVDVAVQLSKAGFEAKRAALGGLKPGEVIPVANGGTTLLFVGGHDAAVCQRLTDYIQRQDWVGVVFSKEPREGTFPLSEARVNSPEAPDLMVSLHWTADRSATGAAGLQVSDLAPTATKTGNHASLSAFDMHNILIAAGPDLRQGVTDTLPSGNTDIAPTILWILGLRDDALQRDGRVLGEALRIQGPQLKSYDLKRITASRKASDGEWSQYLQVSEVNGVRYLDEGNGDFAPKTP